MDHWDYNQTKKLGNPMAVYKSINLTVLSTAVERYHSNSRPHPFVSLPTDRPVWQTVKTFTW